MRSLQRFRRAFVVSLALAGLGATSRAQDSARCVRLPVPAFDSVARDTTFQLSPTAHREARSRWGDSLAMQLRDAIGHPLPTEGWFLHWWARDADSVRVVIRTSRFGTWYHLYSAGDSLRGTMRSWTHAGDSSVRAVAGRWVACARDPGAT